MAEISVGRVLRSKIPRDKDVFCRRQKYLSAGSSIFDEVEFERRQQLVSQAARAREQNPERQGSFCQNGKNIQQTAD